MLVTYFVNFRKLNDHLFGKELFIRFTASAFRKLPSIYVFIYFPFGFEGRMWDLIVSVADHCLSFYYEKMCIKSDFKEIVLKIATNGQSDKGFLLTSTFVPKELSVTALGLYTCIKALKYIPGPGVR